MNTWLHVVRKDVCNFWALLIASSLYVTLETLGWTSDLLYVRYQYEWINLGPDALFLVVCLVSFVVVQADLTVGDRAFWRTRPIGPFSLLAAKVFLLFLVFLAPAVLANTYLAVTMDTPWRVTVGIVLETTGFVALGALSAAFIASITRNLLQAATAAVVAFVVIAYAVSLAGRTQTSNPNLALLPWALDQEYPGPRIVAAGFFGAITLTLLLAHQFNTRRTLRTVMLIFVAVPVALLCTQFYPIDLLSDQTPEKGREPGTEHFAEAQIKFTGTPVVGYRSHMYVPGTSSQVKSLSIEVGATLEGVQVGRMLEIESIDTRFKTKDGKEYTFTPQRQRYWPMWSEDRLKSALCLYLGLKNPPPERRDPNFGSLTLFELPETTAHSLVGQSGTLVATTTMSERRFSLETSLPVKEGATWSHDGQAWVLHRFLPNFNGTNILAMDMRHYRATSMLVPEGNYRPDFTQNVRNRGFVLVNEQRGEYAIGHYMNNGRFGEPGMLATEQLTIAFSELRTPTGVAPISSIDAPWLSNAKLMILQSARLQTFVKKLSIEDFEMPKIDDIRASLAPFWE